MEFSVPTVNQVFIHHSFTWKILTVKGQCLFTMGNVVLCYTRAIIKDDSQFYFFILTIGGTLKF